MHRLYIWDELAFLHPMSDKKYLFDQVDQVGALGISTPKTHRVFGKLTCYTLPINDSPLITDWPDCLLCPYIDTLYLGVLYLTLDGRPVV